jgi:hypothetical protein
MPANREKPVVVPYIEHVPPDVTACVFWTKNRDPKNWRDSQQFEHVLGKYLISDQPMTEEQWARERATVIDDQTNNEPARFGDGREENHLEAAKQIDPVVLEASPLLPQTSGTTKKPNKTKGFSK